MANMDSGTKGKVDRGRNSLRAKRAKFF